MNSKHFLYRNYFGQLEKILSKWFAAGFLIAVGTEKLLFIIKSNNKVILELKHTYTES